MKFYIHVLESGQIGSFLQIGYILVQLPFHSQRFTITYTNPVTHSYNLACKLAKVKGYASEKHIATEVRMPRHSKDRESHTQLKKHWLEPPSIN